MIVYRKTSKEAHAYPYRERWVYIIYLHKTSMDTDMNRSTVDISRIVIDVCVSHLSRFVRIQEPVKAATTDGFPRV